VGKKRQRLLNSLAGDGLRFPATAGAVLSRRLLTTVDTVCCPDK